MKNSNYILIRANRKSIRLTLRHDGNPIVYAPKHYPKVKIDELVEKNLPKLMAKAEKNKETRTDRIFGDTNAPSLMLFGERYPIVRTNGTFFIYNGKEFRVSNTLDNDGILLAYREFLRISTKETVTRLVNEYAEKNSLSYNSITVKNIYSRFGSCSSNKNLNFTLAIAAFDERFIRSVVTHELSHLVHMNHSPDFHKYHLSIFPETALITPDLRRNYSLFIVALCGSRNN